MTEREFNELGERIWDGRRSLMGRHIPLDEIFVVIAEDTYAEIIIYLRKTFNVTERAAIWEVVL